jgi:signal transduction histidine kinase/CheY-like chemotaxis protein
MINDPEFANRFIMNLRIPVIILDADGIPKDWNPSSLRVFPDLEKDAREGTPRHLADYISRRFPIPPENLAPAFLPNGGATSSFDFPATALDGLDGWCRLVIQNQEGDGFFCVIEDITEQKRREIGLTKAKEEAEKTSLSRSQFLANMSHEIRTPIQTIIGMMELLSETKLDEEQSEYTRQVRFSADVMLTLINDILDISKIEAGQMKIENIPFDLPDVIERTIDLVSMEAHKKGLEICVDIEPTLPTEAIGDPVRFRQILLNLVKNAVKFTERGQVLVKAFPLIDPTSSSTRLRVEVIDTGIGVRKDLHEKMFTQFFQADSSTTRKYGGSGLGLAISRNIVELLGGKIGLSDNEPAGSIFWYELPLVAARETAPTAALPRRKETRFLIVDDNSVASGILAKTLSSMGFADSASASSGSAALASLQAARDAGKPFDIVFIDMIMPEMDGWRLAAEINRDHTINEAQLYMMVPEGSFGAEAKMKLLEWFNGYLYKPIKRRMLTELLAEHFQPSIDLEVVEELEPITDATPGAQATRAPGRPSLVKAALALRDLRASPRALARAQTSSVPTASARAAANGATAVPANELFGAGYTVLIAEDHPVNRKLLQTFIEKTGAKVLAAEDGESATELVGTERIDLVFMDIQMPRMNGYEATSWIRGRGYEFPIIACTASAGQDDKEQCLTSGMTAVLPKPYKKQDIFDMMKEHLPKRAPSAMPSPAPSISTVTAKPTTPANQTPQASLGELTDDFDGDQFRDILMGDIAGARSLASEFIAQTTEHMGFLGEDIQGMNREAIKQTAHLIKGSALNMTANGLAAAALAMEQSAATAPKNELEILHRSMGLAFGRLKALIASEGLS